MNNILLRAENLTKFYGGVCALRNFSFSLDYGQVHALVGENGAGKSTFVKILAGVIQPSSGEIWIEGKQFKGFTPLQALHLGIQVVHQDLSLFPNLTVAENVFIPTYARKNLSIIKWRSVHQHAEKAIKSLGVDIPLDVPLRVLSIGDRQLVAIARAIFAGAKILILDEPTSALSHKEIIRLFSVVKNLKEKGVAVIFISHKLNEVLTIADKITIIKDGVYMGTYESKQLTKEKLEFLMSGEVVSKVLPATSTAIKRETPLLRVENLTRKKEFQDVSFELFPGEVVGLIGPLGAGRTQLALCIIGVTRPEKGKIFFEGKEVRFSSVREAYKAGIVYCPEDRLNLGLILNYSVAFNSTAPIHGRLRNALGLLSKRKITEATYEAIAKLGIKTSGPTALVSSLSGGNQQKVVISRILSLNPKLIIVDNPTFGIDVGTKAYIHFLLRRLAESGMGVLFISDEAGEVIRCSDRILIMRDGKILKAVESQNITEEELIELIYGNQSDV